MIFGQNIGQNFENNSFLEGKTFKLIARVRNKEKKISLTFRLFI